MAEKTGKSPEVADHNVDRYPTLRKVLHAVANDPQTPEGQVERVEITALASGEATYRVWEPRAEEPIGGYYRSL